MEVWQFAPRSSEQPCLLSVDMICHVMQSRFNLPADVATVTNMLERLNQEIKGRSHVIRIPNEESSLRLIRTLAVEIHEDWRSHRYLKHGNAS